MGFNYWYVSNGCEAALSFGWIHCHETGTYNVVLLLDYSSRIYSGTIMQLLKQCVYNFILTV
jgi:hypothetical protein